MHITHNKIWSAMKPDVSLYDDYIVPNRDYPSKDYLSKDYSSKDRRMSKDSDTTIEASHHITVEVLSLG